MGKQKRITMDELRGIVENEGLGYAIQAYISPERMPTEEIEEIIDAATDQEGWR